MEPPGKAAEAFRTIGEVSRDTGVAQHVLRYWEQRFPQLQPLTRAGQRRYYRPADVALVRRIAGLLEDQGYTIRGVQQLLAQEERHRSPAAPGSAIAPGALAAIRDALAHALATDDRR